MIFVALVLLYGVTWLYLGWVFMLLFALIHAEVATTIAPASYVTSLAVASLLVLLHLPSALHVKLTRLAREED